MCAVLAEAQVHAQGEREQMREHGIAEFVMEVRTTLERMEERLTELEQKSNNLYGWMTQLEVDNQHTHQDILNVVKQAESNNNEQFQKIFQIFEKVMGGR